MEPTGLFLACNGIALNLMSHRCAMNINTNNPALPQDVHLRA
jgi:hypothetical protein